MPYRGMRISKAKNDFINIEYSFETELSDFFFSNTNIPEYSWKNRVFDHSEFQNHVSLGPRIEVRKSQD